MKNMSATVYYKNKCLITCSSSFLSDLSDKIIELGLNRGYALNESLLGYTSIMNYSWIFSLEDELSTNEVKLYAELAIEAIDMMFAEGYFILKPEAVKARIERNIPLNIPMRDHMPALEYKENLKEILKELNKPEK